MNRDYRFVVENLDVTGHKVITEGTVNADVGDMSVFSEVMRASFRQLTQGKAVYGHPGVGCQGPYSITKIVIEEAP